VYSIAFSSHLSVLEIVHVEWISMHSQCNHSPPLGVCSFIVHSRRTTLQSVYSLPSSGGARGCAHFSNGRDLWNTTETEQAVQRSILIRITEIYV